MKAQYGESVTVRYDRNCREIDLRIKDGAGHKREISLTRGQTKRFIVLLQHAMMKFPARKPRKDEA